MKIGTRIPPPVHANTILTNLKLSGASGFILLNTLFPIRQKSNKRQRKVRNACPNNTFIFYLPDISNILTVKEGISKQTQVSLHCANTMVLALGESSTCGAGKCKERVAQVIQLEQKLRKAKCTSPTEAKAFLIELAGLETSCKV